MYVRFFEFLVICIQSYRTNYKSVAQPVIEPFIVQLSQLPVRVLPLFSAADFLFEEDGGLLQHRQLYSPSLQVKTTHVFPIYPGHRLVAHC